MSTLTHLPASVNSRLCLKIVNAAKRQTGRNRANSNACRVLADALDDEGEGGRAATWRAVADFCDRYSLKMYRYSNGNRSTYFYAVTNYASEIEVYRFALIGVSRSRTAGPLVPQYLARCIAQVNSRTGSVTGIGLYNRRTRERDTLPSLDALAEFYSLPEL